MTARPKTYLKMFKKISTLDIFCPNKMFLFDRNNLFPKFQSTSENQTANKMVFFQWLSTEKQWDIGLTAKSRSCNHGQKVKRIGYEKQDYKG